MPISKRLAESEKKYSRFLSSYQIFCGSFRICFPNANTDPCEASKSKRIRIRNTSSPMATPTGALSPRTTMYMTRVRVGVPPAIISVPEADTRH